MPRQRTLGPQLRDEPLIFIEVALTHGMSAQVQPLLDVNAPVIAPARADCAIFYSITNCQEGLRGTSFGNLLIKQVAEDLIREAGQDKLFDAPIVTEVAPLSNYWPAEDYHQDFFEKNPFQGYCMAVAAPKVQKFRKTFSELARK